jgi:phosphoribosylamine--glycine ligase
MNVLIIDSDGAGLPFALLCQEHGHEVKLWGETRAGIGMVPKIKDWASSMKWADLIFLTDNAHLVKELAPYFKRGFPIFGPNSKGAELELDRGLGQKVFDKYGIKTLPYKNFNNYDKAIAYVQAEGKPFVSKPWGGEADKDLSYVPRTAEDLICRLERWRDDGNTDEFLLQEMCDGYEMAVGGWFGPEGWLSAINENWEEKRMLRGRDRGSGDGSVSRAPRRAPAPYGDDNLGSWRGLSPRERGFRRSRACAKEFYWKRRSQDA